MNISFLDTLDKDKLNDMCSNAVNNSEPLVSILQDVVASCTESLDNVMKEIYLTVIAADDLAPLDVIEKYFLELTNAIYFVSDKTEKLGLYDSISKSVQKEAYNNIYLSSTNDVTDKKSKPTVAELTAIAESGSQYESVVNEIYNKAYKIVKNKVDSANSMSSALSKIISKRLAEMSFTPITTNNRQILNEG